MSGGKSSPFGRQLCISYACGYTFLTEHNVWMVLDVEDISQCGNGEVHQTFLIVGIFRGSLARCLSVLVLE